MVQLLQHKMCWSYQFQTKLMCSFNNQYPCLVKFAQQSQPQHNFCCINKTVHFCCVWNARWCDDEKVYRWWAFRVILKGENPIVNMFIVLTIFVILVSGMPGGVMMKRQVDFQSYAERRKYYCKHVYHTSSINMFTVAFQHLPCTTWHSTHTVYM